jgi:hypothetical protein
MGVEFGLLTTREIHVPKMFENRGLCVFELTRDEDTGGCMMRTPITCTLRQVKEMGKKRSTNGEEWNAYRTCVRNTRNKKTTRKTKT